MKKAFFFDMDGVVFDSMPRHAQAWEIVMKKHGLPFTARDCYLQEGRTGHSVIDECFMKVYGRHAEEAEWKQIYKENTEWFFAQGPIGLVPGIKELLYFLKEHPEKPQIYLVTGSAKKTLLDEIEQVLPGVFTRERMVTAFDYQHCKPDPEPYLMAFAKAAQAYEASHDLSAPFFGKGYDYAESGILRKEDCCVVENAPLGVRSGKAAGLPAVAVNTGILSDDDLWVEGADQVFPNMPALLDWLKSE
ncbi:MAG: HAD hydrolase-like protein [Paludibacteraceae bacterium]|nr:HAD hydrolase-like protein [Paludibacteraceae bacterium]